MSFVDPDTIVGLPTYSGRTPVHIRPFSPGDAAELFRKEYIRFLRCWFRLHVEGDDVYRSSLLTSARIDAILL